VSHRLVCCAAALAVVLFVAPVPAADPPPVEMLPPPQAVLPPPHMVPPPPMPMELMLFPRHNRYEVWQYSAVNRYGQWRPRVITTGDEGYYLYNGAPFPWVTTHPEEVMPRVMLPASFR
jgi:hypothetical protein